MATTQTGAGGFTQAGALGTLFNKKVINSLQPNLYFESLATVSMVAEGNTADRFVMFDQIASSSVTTLTEAVAPTGVAVTVTPRDITPTQYGISVELSDLVVLTSFIDLMNETAVEVGYATARKIDEVIQVTANAGTNVIYGGGKTSRATLAAGDNLDTSLILRAAQKLSNGSAPQFAESMYRAVGTVEQIYDLKSNTTAGQWIDVHKYATPDRIFNGEIGSIHGVRIMQSPNVTKFSSTVTVSPMLVTGTGSFRVSYWLPNKVKSYINPPEAASIANPLGQKGSIGAKVNIGASRTQEARMVRIETAATAL